VKNGVKWLTGTPGFIHITKLPHIDKFAEKWKMEYVEERDKTPARASKE
jgi:hypothetical protein